MASEVLERVIEALRERRAQPDESWEERRASMEANQARLEIPSDVVATSVDAPRGEWVSIEDRESRGTLLYLHGGGYCVGSTRTHRELVARMCREARLEAFVVDYRLAPEAPHPAALADAVAAYEWLLERGHSAHRLVVAGDSAGGGLALALLLRLRDEGRPLPACGVCLSAWTDLELTGDSLASRAKADPMVTGAGLEGMAAAYAGDDRTHPYVSPVRGAFDGLPPLLLQVGDAEVLLDDSVRVAEAARAASVESRLTVYPEMIHVFQAFPMLNEAAVAIREMADFVSEALGETPA